MSSTIAAKRPPRPLPQVLTIGAATAIVGSLGKPSKMPGYAFGLSAKRCRRGTELRKVPGSVCSSCYAMNDFYATWRPVQIGHDKRHAGLAHPRWVDAMVTLIAHYCKPPADYFRWHDSGDIQSLEHFRRIVAVCERTPQVKHWIPTREYETVAQFLRASGTIPENLCVRLSGEMIDAEPVIPQPELAGFPTSTVQTAGSSTMGEVQLVDGKGSIECRAVEARENICGPCRACWDPRVKNVSYPQH